MNVIVGALLVVSMACFLPVEGDRGGCPRKWKRFEGFCYFFGTELKKWADAREVCKSKGGDLTIDNAGNHAFLSAEVEKLDKSGCDPVYLCNLHIGLTYEANGGYTWVDGTALKDSDARWQPGEPNNNDRAGAVEFELRTVDKTNLLWNDRPFDWDPATGWFVCQREKYTCPPGWLFFGQSCYYFGTDKKTWSDARTFCKAKGGDLAIDDADNHSFLSKEVGNLDKSGCDPIYHCNLHIGLSYKANGGYTWVDGTAMKDSDARWQPGEPNNNDRAGSVEFELRTTDKANLLWNDRPFDWNPNKMWYICEFKVEY